MGDEREKPDIRFTSIANQNLNVTEVIFGECLTGNLGVFGRRFKACYVTFGTDGLRPLD